MVNGGARLVKMCRHRSGLDELMVILDGTTMFAKAFVVSLQCTALCISYIQLDKIRFLDLKFKL